MNYSPASDFEKGRTDGYQWTVNSYRFSVNPAYARGVAEGRALRQAIHASLANARGDVTFASICGFMRRYNAG